jgi:thymidylate synthase (FAD)
MKIIEQKVKMLNRVNGVEILKRLEFIGRNCYNSYDKITDDSYEDFIKKLISKGHDGILEHVSITFAWQTSRAVMAEITRHRISSFSVQSQRYVKYGELYIIKPIDYEIDEDMYEHLLDVEENYKKLIKEGKTPQQARDILPNMVATNILFTMNLRELRHMLKLRCHVSSLPLMRDIAIKTLRQLHVAIPIVFDDLAKEYL